MNYMKEVAQLLGVEIGEEFKIGNEYRYKFTEECLMALFPNGKWYIAPYALYEILNGKYKVTKLPKPILTDEEKEYLSYVIKPFRNRIKYFYKWTCADCNYEQIMAACTDYSNLTFPAFKKNSMYKDMESNKKYTLEDLGL